MCCLSDGCVGCLSVGCLSAGGLAVVCLYVGYVGWLLFVWPQMAVLTVVVEQTRQTALHTAAAEDSVETAELLLGARAALDIKDNVRTTCRWIHAMV